MAETNQLTKADLEAEIEDLNDRLDEISEVAAEEDADPEEQLDSIADIADEEEDSLDSDGSEEDAE